MMHKNFYLDSAYVFENTLVIRIPDNIYKICKGNSSSYNIIKARLFDLSYPDFLRMCRDKYEAGLVGKQGYSSAFWKESNRNKAQQLVDELNNRWKKWESKAFSEGLL